MTIQLSKTAHAVMDLARETAREAGDRQPHTGHLLIGVLGTGGTAARLLARIGADLDTVQRLAEEESVAAGAASSDANRSKLLQAVIRHAKTVAVTQGRDVVDSEQILLGMVEAGDGIAINVLSSAGIDVDRLKSLIRNEEAL